MRNHVIIAHGMSELDLLSVILSIYKSKHGVNCRGTLNDNVFIPVKELSLNRLHTYQKITSKLESSRQS